MTKKDPRQWQPWYEMEFAADVNVRLMTNNEELAYRRILGQSWHQVGFPEDQVERWAKVWGCTPQDMAPALALMELRDGRYFSARQEAERALAEEQFERVREARRAAGRLGGIKSGVSRSKTKQNEANAKQNEATLQANEANEPTVQDSTGQDRTVPDRGTQVPVPPSGIERVETQTRKKRARAKKPWIEQARELVAPIEPHRKAWEAWVEAQEGLPASRRATPSALKSHAKKLGEFGADAMGLVEFAIDTSARGFSPEMLRVHRERLAQGPRGGLLAGPGAKDGVPAKVRAQYAELHQARKAVFNPQKADWGELTAEQQRDFERLDGQIDEILRGYPQLARGVAS